MERTVICSEFVRKMDWPKDSMADSTRIDSKGRYRGPGTNRVKTH
jgi:hypothetical protein